MSALIDDKGYDANYMGDAARLLEAEAGIPPRSQRKTPRYYDRDLYKERNLIELMFNKFKNLCSQNIQHSRAFVRMQGIAKPLKALCTTF